MIDGELEIWICDSFEKLYGQAFVAGDPRREYVWAGWTRVFITVGILVLIVSYARRQLLDSKGEKTREHCAAVVFVGAYGRCSKARQACRKHPDVCNQASATDAYLTVDRGR